MGGERLPSGTVTFLFTDIERSTQTLAALGDDAYAEALRTHRDLLRATFEQHNGVEVGTEGDAFFVAFSRAGDAVAAAIDGQRALEAHAWPGDARIRVRMGLHTGEVLLREGDYIGHDVHKAKRISDAGHGGQILLSELTAGLIAAHLPEGATISDLGPHRLKDLSGPQPLYQVIVDGLERDFPKLRSLEWLDHNLPGQLSTFIGREHELEELRGLISRTRLLTITGAGGSGKTRIALQLLADILPETPDGVWVADLGALTDPALAATVVLDALFPSRTQETSAQDANPAMDRLIARLRDKHAVVLLDNCEHLLRACVDLVDGLLRACGQLKIVVTTREALGLAGETSWRLPSLRTPDDDVTLDDVLSSEATRLFCERAADADPSFWPTDAEARSIADICRRLDGIPLAIELAASRVRLLPVDEIARRLDDRFRLLTGGSRTALPRQQTLRATVDWSYDLLDDRQRSLLRRLAVFAGGFDLAAAEGVCADKTLAAADVLDGVGELVDRSLVVRYERTGAQRFRMLETVRQYAREKLMDSGDGIAARQAHAGYFVSFIEEAERDVRSPNEKRWMEAFDREIDNLRAAFEWLISTDPAAALWFSGRWWFPACAGYSSDVAHWAETALAVTPDGPSADRAAALRTMAFVTWGRAGIEAAMPIAEQALRESLQVGDVDGASWAYFELLNFPIFGVRPGFAAPHVEPALAYGAEHSLPLLEADALQAAALTDRTLRADERVTRLERAAAIYREVGDPHIGSQSVRTLGRFAVQRSDLAEARRCFEEAVALSHASGCVGCTTISDLHLAWLDHHEGRVDAAARILIDVLPRGRNQLGVPGLSSALFLAGTVLFDKGAAKESTVVYGAAGDDSPMEPTISGPAAIRREKLRTELGESAFDELTQVGAQMPLDRALNFARDALSDS
jgi:predicted ATPase/class 3 adenylate cyclase